MNISVFTLFSGTLVGEEAMMLSAKLLEIFLVNSYSPFASSCPFILLLVAGSTLAGLSSRFTENNNCS